MQCETYAKAMDPHLHFPSEPKEDHGFVIESCGDSTSSSIVWLNILKGLFGPIRMYPLGSWPASQPGQALDQSKIHQWEGNLDTYQPIARIQNLRSRFVRQIEAITRDYCPERIIIHGPHATGDAGPDDELGLLIIKETSERALYRCVSVRKILAGIADSPPLDILVLTEDEFREAKGRNDPYLNYVLDSGIEVYAG